MNLNLGPELRSAVRLLIAGLWGQVVVQLALWIQWLERFFETDIHVDLNRPAILTTMTMVAMAGIYKAARVIERRWPWFKVLGLSNPDSQ